MNKIKIKKGDQVLVIAGENKGSKGSVLKVLYNSNKALVEGVNTVKRHTKPNSENPKGGIIEKQLPIDISNLSLMTKDGEKTRIGFKNEDGNTAESGIGGERTINDYVAALTSAHNLEELEFALEKLAAQKEPAIDKAALVQGGMAKKRSSKDIWSKDIQAKFMKLVQSL